jgi:predicted TIM-barrel fold metal-dependent hydrolase
VPEDAHGPQGYRPTVEVLAALVGELSPDEQRAVMGDTARRVYRLL